jgi:activator of HSP90 ATPase
MSSKKIYTKKFDVTATPKQVYTMWVTPAYHGAVTKSLASIIPKEGGDIRLWSGAVTGNFIELQQDQRILQTWRTVDFSHLEKPSILLLEFQKQLQNCRIRIEHSEIPNHLYPQFEFAWEEFYIPRIIHFFLPDRHL